MIISNVYIFGKNGMQDIHIEKERIVAANNPAAGMKEGLISFSGAMAFPGIINSHDHLDFNLFPQLGNRKYLNYKEWGEDIYEKNKDTINAVLHIPLQLRKKWGLYKNLLNGVTTVVDHGKKTALEDGLISVFQHCHSLHSLHYEKWWKWKLNNPFIRKLPFVIHVGEGTDDAAGKEIEKLVNCNLLKKELIAVHGVAMSARQAGAFKALVWCPASNYFLLDETADLAMLKNKVPVIFGTDSTLSAVWNFWDHLRLARKNQGLTETELYESVNSRAASVWKLKECGSLEEGKLADIVVAKVKDHSLDSFYSIDPGDILMVMHHGEIILFDGSLQEQLVNINLAGFSRIMLGDNCKYVKGDLPLLMHKIWQFYPEARFPVSIPL